MTGRQDGLAAAGMEGFGALSGQGREATIVDRAIAFFAEHGLHGNTRDLARSIGVSQPLLYHYFPSKDALIERVVDQLFSDRWRPEWREQLRRSDVPLRQRLEQFYLDYSETILTREWTRILFFASLAGMDLYKRQQALARERALRLIARELRREAGLLRSDSIGAADLEVAGRLHSGVFQLAVRRWVFNSPAARSQAVAIREEVGFFLHGARSLLAERAMGGSALKLAAG